MKSYIPKLIEQTLQNTLSAAAIIGAVAYSFFVLPSYLQTNHRDASDIPKHYDCGIIYGKPQSARTYDFVPFFGLNSNNYRTIENIARLHGFHVIKEGRNIVDFFHPEDPKSRVIRLRVIPDETIDQTLDEICDAIEKAA